MQLKRTLALATAAAALTFPLASCGFDYATDRVYNVGVGSNAREGRVDVLAGVIVSAEPGSGIFVASLANNDDEDAATLESVAGQAVETESFAPVEVPPGELVDLADEGGVEVSGDFEAGQFVDVTLTFASGQEVTVGVPVIPNSGDYAGLGPLPEPEDPRGVPAVESTTAPELEEGSGH